LNIRLVMVVTLGNFEGVFCDLNHKFEQYAGFKQDYRDAIC